MRREYSKLQRAHQAKEEMTLSEKLRRQKKTWLIMFAMRLLKLVLNCFLRWPWPQCSCESMDS